MSEKRPVRIWTCDNCGKAARWGEGWQHKYKIRLGDTSELLIVVCSDECAEKMDRNQEEIARRGSR